MLKNKLENLNKKIISDPLTGGKQTIYWNDEHTFFMSIPHQGIKMPEDFKFPKVKTTKSEDGKITYWER